MLSSRRDAFAEVLQSRRREHLFVEVVLIHGINDSPELARALAALLRPLPTRANINLLPYNDTGHAVFRASTREAVEEFQRVLMNEGLVATIRTARYGAFLYRHEIDRWLAGGSGGLQFAIYLSCVR